MSLDEFGGRRTPSRIGTWTENAEYAPESGGERAPIPAEQEWARQGIATLLLCIAALIAVEALLFARGHVLSGQIADAVLLFLILQVRPGPVRRSPTSWLSLRAPWLEWNPSAPAREAIRSLALVPLIRVVSIGLPLRDVSHAGGTLAVALIVGWAALVLAPAVGVAPRTFLTARLPGAQLQAMLGGLLLGFVAYLLGAPALWPAGASADRALLGLVAVVAAAVAEELVFRGVVQVTLQRAMGRAGVLAAAALFASTYLGAGSASLVLTVALAGLVFGYTVLRTGGLSGVVCGHVLFALGAGAVWPALLGRTHPSLLSVPDATIGLAVATAGMTAIIIRRDGGHERSSVDQLAVGPSSAGAAIARATSTSWWGTIAVLVCLVLAAAIVGFTIARAGREPGPITILDRTASVGFVRVAYPSAWRRQSSDEHALGLQSGLTLTPAPGARQALVIGLGTAGEPSPLPNAARATLEGSPRPDTVRLGGLLFYRYLNTAPRSGGPDEALYALRTTKGSAVAICRGGTPGTNMANTCERILATMRLTSATPFPPNLAVGYAHALNAVIRELNSVRTRAVPLLRAHARASQIRGMQHLARAHERAAADLAAVNAGSATAASGAFVQALKRVGAAYKALALAASRRDPAAYRKAQAELASATDALDSGFAALRRLGYSGG